MIDEKHNPEHCLECTGDCGMCQDAFKKPGGLKTGRSVFGPVWVSDPDGYMVWRYAQHKALEELAKLATGAKQ